MAHITFARSQLFQLRFIGVCHANPPGKPGNGHAAYAIFILNICEALVRIRHPVVGADLEELFLLINFLSENAMQSRRMILAFGSNLIMLQLQPVAISNDLHSLFFMS